MYAGLPFAWFIVPWSTWFQWPWTRPSFIGFALPPKLSCPSAAAPLVTFGPTMYPPPVTQHPPAVGGTQSFESPSASGTHAPHADGCVPSAQIGTLSHFLLPFLSSTHLNFG